MRGRDIPLPVISASLFWLAMAFTARGVFGDTTPQTERPSVRPKPTSVESKAKGRPSDSAVRIRHASKPGSQEGACRKAEHGFTPEREAAALTFVNQYHPELARLLPVLKKKDELEYCRAVRDLFRTSERLALYREKSPDRYDVELKAWQVKSRIQLLATRLRMTPDDPGLREQLKAALHEQCDLRLRLLAQERQKMSERLRRLDEQIDAMRAQKERMADQQFQLLVRMPHKKPPTKQKPNPPVKSKPTRPVKEQGKIEKATAKPVPEGTGSKPQ